MSGSRYFKTLFGTAVFLTAASLAVASNMPPHIMSGTVYKDGVNVAEYLVSEKLDGVRAYWDGEKLVSRSGNTFSAPDWFTADFPPEPMDGELWIGRNSFEQTVSTVRRNSPHDGWRKVKYMVFDLPAHKGDFDKRYKHLKKIVAKSASRYLKPVRQFRVKSAKNLEKELDRVTKAGGEGLILHKRKSFYQKGKSRNVLKLKKFYDAEAVVIRHNPGKGKFRGMLGSVTVETSDGIRFKIGTGFTDSQRKKPPAVGSVITYKYRGLTNSGKPKFPSFWRVRSE